MQLRTQIGVSVTVLLILIATASAQDWRRLESRDHGMEFVGFIQPDHLYWRPFVLPSVQPAEFKLLSLDGIKAHRHSALGGLLHRLFLPKTDRVYRQRFQDF